MKRPATTILLFMISVLSLGATYAQEVGVRMGAGDMTFDTVPNWGLSNEGLSQIGSTHGGVVVDKAGLIYTTSSLGIFVFNADGKIVNRFLGDDYSNIHDIEIRDEDGTEYLYAARNKNAEGLKISAETGDIVLKLTYPEKCGLGLKKISPTAITVAGNGDIYLSDGYGSNTIFRFDADGKYLSHFGKKGNGMKEFNTAHGMTLDTRVTPNRLLICDRNHKPKGRLVHYDLDGNFIQEVITGLGMPTSVAIQGNFVSVPDLQGRLAILDGTNKIIAVLGHNPDPKVGRSFGVAQKNWVEGIFSGTHGSFWDKDGNLYVQDWNTSGRIIKLVRVAR
ncbi:MAG: 6-bladed beta-propeller [Fuerstiella sp.]